MKEERFNTIAIIGCLIGMLVFGGGVIGNYFHGQERLTSVEVQLVNIQLQLRDIRDELKSGKYSK